MQTLRAFNKQLYEVEPMDIWTHEKNNMHTFRRSLTASER